MALPKCTPTKRLQSQITAAEVGPTAATAAIQDSTCRDLISLQEVFCAVTRPLLRFSFTLVKTPETIDGAQEVRRPRNLELSGVDSSRNHPYGTPWRSILV